MEAEFRVQSYGSDVGRVNSSDHDMLTATLGLGDKPPNEFSSHASPLHDIAYINRMFNA